LTALALSALGAWSTPAPSLAAAQCWSELPNTKLRAVLAPAPAGVPAQSWWNPVQIMQGYSGAALDTKRSRLLVWGGGHADYPGNELYALEFLPVPRALRLTDPSPYAMDQTTEALADGRPTSRHTYSGLVFLPDQDALWAYGGSLWREGWPSRATWLFSFASGRWERKADAPGSGREGQTLVPIADYDPETRLVVVRGRNFIGSYDPATGRWDRRGGAEHSGSERTGRIATPRRKMYVVGWTRGQKVPGLIRVIDLGSWKEEKVKTTGDTEMTTVPAPGLDVDPERGDLVAWAGGPDLYRLNLSTMVWTRISPSGGARPGPTYWEGTYGRFRYVPALKKFVAVASIDRNAFAYGAGPCGE
jgi:hypothetical protein